MIKFLPTISLADRWRALANPLKQPIVLTSAIVTGLVAVGWQLGTFQYLEQVALDQMIRWRGDRGPDPRMLVVAITEEDLAKTSFPISDRVLAQLLQKLQQHQPRVIGLDLFRDLPKPPGQAELAPQLAQPNLIVITRLLTEENPTGIAPPPKVPPERVGFNDVVLDPDGVLRRNWLFGHSDTERLYSFGLRVTQTYLAPQNITPQPDWYHYDAEPWGKAIFTPLEPNSGGYRTIDSAGYQILLNYRSPKNSAHQVTLSQVLAGQVDDRLIRDKIVLIGSTAPSVRDVFLTPYSSADQETAKMPGVLIHAQMISQLLDAVAGDRSLIQFWPEWVEGSWLWFWALMGGLLAWRVRHPLPLALAGSGGLLMLTGSGFGLLLAGVWVPVVAPAATFLLTGGGVLAYTAYQAQQQQRAISHQAKEQEKTIALLRTLLAETTRPMTAVTRPNDVTATQMTTGGDDAFTQSHTSPLTGTDPKTVIQIDERKRDGLPSLLGGRYRVLKVLGYGGFSLTYLAQDTHRPGHPVCVVKHLLPARNDEKFLQTARRLFRTEAEILEKLGVHDQIPQLLASFEEQGRFYLIQEYIEGPSLSEELEQRQPYSEAEVISLLRDMLEVLAFVHSYQVIHRDIKPSNIIRRKQDDRLVLIDFGAVKQMQPPEQGDREGSTIAIGTRGYAPAEQLAGHPGLTSDIYALGMIALQVLTGVPPQQLENDPSTGDILWRHRTQVSSELATLIDRMTKYYFNERYPSAQEALHDLKRLIT